MGLTATVIASPASPPMTAQNGSTMPTKTRPRSSWRPVATAGSQSSVCRVSSIQGMGISRIGSISTSPESAGNRTYTPPNSRPIMPPIEKTRHFHPRSRSSVDSASAMVPRAATGAIGKGSFSTSEVMR